MLWTEIAVKASSVKGKEIRIKLDQGKTARDQRNGYLHEPDCDEPVPPVQGPFCQFFKEHIPQFQKDIFVAVRPLFARCSLVF